MIQTYINSYQAIYASLNSNKIVLLSKIEFINIYTSLNSNKIISLSKIKFIHISDKYCNNCENFPYTTEKDLWISDYT